MISRILFLLTNLPSNPISSVILYLLLMCEIFITILACSSPDTLLSTIIFNPFMSSVNAAPPSACS